MTNKEAIKEMRKFERRHYEKPNGDADLNVYEALKMAIEALEKQIPKKPKGRYCPRCCSALPYAESEYNERVLYKIDFCWDCGQAIDWTEVKK